MIEIKVPAVGESITEGMLVSWFKENGEVVRVDDPLFELETDKITMTVAAEHAGRLAIQVAAGTKVKIGQVVGAIDTSAAATAAGTIDRSVRAAPSSSVAPGSPSSPSGAPVPAPASSSASVAPESRPEGPPLSPPAGLPQVAAKIASGVGLADLAPAVRRLVEEKGLDPTLIPASGKGGRLTKEDVVLHLEKPAPQPASSPLIAGPAGERGPGERQTRVKMTMMRQRIAERLVIAQQAAAILTTFNECDMSAVAAMRERFKERFRERHQVGLGLMSFFVKAAVDALHAVPVLNAQIDGDEIVHNHSYDIGVAVGTEHGLVVPVVRDADRLSFAGIEATIAALAARARARTLTLADISGGTFTISNGGVYGSLLSTPILNPPQSGILGLHGIKKRPVVVDDQIAIRPMMYLALSYDHRLVDGQDAVAFLRRVVECIENPERLLLEA